MKTINLTKPQANAILCMIAEVYELEYCNLKGDLCLFGEVIPAQEINNLRKALEEAYPELHV